MRNLRNKFLGLGSLLVMILLCAVPFRVAAQGDDISSLKQRAGALIEQKNYVEAVPVLEKIAAAEPDDGKTQFYLGIALYVRAETLKGETRKQERVRARRALEKAKRLGVEDVLLDSFLSIIPPDGSDPKGSRFSENEEAHQAMKAGEAAFAAGKMEEALKSYEKALQLDPQIYEGALFSGDVYLQTGDFAKAEEWYQKAIKINPDRETAYRYSATPLMRQRKIEQARDRYVEAFICAPYNNLARNGLVQWGQIAGVQLGHPDIKIPVNVSSGKKGEVDIVQGISGKDDDGSSVWFFYGLARAEWQTEKDGQLSGKFKKAYPNEKTYRHSLAEEVGALNKTIQILRETKNKPKQLDPSLARLVKLYDAGLLEAYILLARPDEGIVQDYPAYFKANRDKLRRYMVEYVVKGGGE